MLNGNRWYDKHSRVSFAVGCLEEADDILKSKLARVIVKQALQFEIKASRPKTGLFRRWYDKHKDLSLAMEYFRLADEKQRVVIAERIIAYIKENNIPIKM